MNKIIAEFNSNSFSSNLEVNYLLSQREMVFLRRQWQLYDYQKSRVLGYKIEQYLTHKAYGYHITFACANPDDILRIGLSFNQMMNAYKQMLGYKIY